MNKSKTKFYNTAVKMNNALFALLEKKSFQDITITNICEKADVNRSTFYAHYDNMYDLLEESKKNLFSEFFSTYKDILTIKDIEGLSIEESNFVTARYIIPYLTFIQEHKTFFQVYMDNLKIFAPDEMLQFMLTTTFIPVLKKHGIADETLSFYLAKYYLTGITAIIQGWLERNCEDDIHFISEIIIMCIRPNIE